MRESVSLSVRWFGVLLGLLVAAGVGLRFHELDQRSLWGDELGTLAIAQFYPFLPAAGQPLYRRIQVTQIGDGDTFLTAKAAEQSPPLNDLLEKATVRWRDGWRSWRPPGWTEIGLFTLVCYTHYIAALLVVLLLSADAVMATKCR